MYRKLKQWNLLFLLITNTSFTVVGKQRVISTQNMNVDLANIIDDAQFYTYVLSSSTLYNAYLIKEYFYKQYYYNARFRITEYYKQLLKSEPDKADIIRRKYKEKISDLSSKYMINKFIRYSDTLLETNKNKILIYFKRHGFLNAEVISQIHKNDSRNFVNIDYVITPNERYYINDYKNNNDSNVEDQLIHIGDPLDFDIIEAEKERIYAYYKNHGFVFFPKEAISFIVKCKKNGACRILTKIHCSEEKLKKHKHDKIIVNMSCYDSPNVGHRKTKIYKDLTLSYDKYMVRDIILYNNIMMKSGNRYNLDDEQLTYKRLYSTGVFQNVNIQHKYIEDALVTDIDCIFRKKYNINHNLGFRFKKEDIKKFQRQAIEIYYAFNLELLDLLKSLDINTVSVSINEPLYYADKKYINIPYIGLDYNIKYSNFLVKLFPHLQTSSTIPINFKLYPHTNLEINNSQYKLDVIRFNLALQYSINDVKHTYEVKINPIKYDRYYKKGSLHKNIIESVEFDYTYASLHDTDTLVNIDSTTYTDIGYIFDNKISVFWRNTFEFKNTAYFNENNRLITRFNIGVLIFLSQYQNSYEDIHFGIGGSTTIRGWELNHIGPGHSKMKANNIAQKGDFLLFFNAEFRRKLTSLLEFATFIDAGNVWKFKSNNVNEQLTASRFFKDIAFGTGVGLRFNFKVIIFCVDIGLQMYDPHEQKWFYDSKANLHINFQYPF